MSLFEGHTYCFVACTTFHDRICIHCLSLILFRQVERDRESLVATIVLDSDGHPLVLGRSRPTPTSVVLARGAGTFGVGVGSRYS